MFKLPIDENTCIIQPYFDGGDSYPGNKKYSLISRYRTVPKGIMRQAWDSVVIKLRAKDKAIAEIDGLDIDISDFTSFRLFLLVSKNVRVKLYCNDEPVMDEYSRGGMEQIESNIITTQKIIKTLKYEFYNENDIDVEAGLYYLGMINNKRKNKNTFTSEWEGFFAEQPSYELFDDAFIGSAELEALRKRIKTDPYKAYYERTKSFALERMKEEPETKIQKTVSDYFRQPDNISGMIELALIGQIDRNCDMLKMACRCALSVASCEYWCCDPMETAPTVTWHHRSFTEAETARQVSAVISLAGGLLSWHGRNFLYNMIIMKALPRMEADFMTMEYIYHSNQGIAFMSGYVPALAVLSGNYPRYGKRINEAENLLEEMLGNAFLEDGSSGEGANYWQYTVISYLYSAYFLARYRKKSVKEYVGNKLDKISEFGLSLINEKGYMITVGDTNRGMYGSDLSAMLYEITGDKRWARLFWQQSAHGSAMAMIMTSSAEVPKSNECLVREFLYMPVMGYTQICRDNIHIFTVSGPSNSTHCHLDKGSFIVYKNGEDIIPDIMTVYTDPEAGRLQKTQSHSLATPEKDGHIIQQLRGDGISSTVCKAEYKDGVFEWKCDNKGVWDDKVVKKNIRTIVSQKPDELVITDRFELNEAMNVSFRINLKDRESVKVEPVNWVPIKEKYTELYSSDDICIYQLVLTADMNKKHDLITRITIL